MGLEPTATFSWQAGRGFAPSEAQTLYPCGILPLLGCFARHADSVGFQGIHSDLGSGLVLLPKRGHGLAVRLLRLNEWSGRACTRGAFTLRTVPSVRIVERFVGSAEAPEARCFS